MALVAFSLMNILDDHDISTIWMHHALFLLSFRACAEVYNRDGSFFVVLDKKIGDRYGIKRKVLFGH